MAITERESAALDDVIQEYVAATNVHGAFHSPHEAYAVILEELDELWDEVKRKKGARDLDAMRKEAAQVAAMALRFIVDICSEA